MTFVQRSFCTRALPNRMLHWFVLPKQKGSGQLVTPFHGPTNEWWEHLRMDGVTLLNTCQVLSGLNHNIPLSTE